MLSCGVIDLCCSGLVSRSLEWYDRLLTSPAYSTVSAHREIWRRQRHQLTTLPATGMHKVHIFAVASKPCDELDFLLYTAKIAGVEINVSGCGRTI
jgi:hypothetical protein